jgi:exonuclease III
MRRPDIVALCETKLHENSKFEISGYKTLKSNLKAGKEGILVAVRQGTFNSIELVYESELKNIATAEIQYPEESVQVVVVHGPQEDASIEEKEEFYNDLCAEAERCLAGGKRLIIAGDLNAKLNSENEKNSSGNGKRLKEMIDKYELSVKL